MPWFDAKQGVFFGAEKMRYVLLAVTVFAAGMATPTLAGQESSADLQPPSSAHSFEDCNDLGWIRGVHNERDELPDWNAQCMNGQIPFGEDYSRYYKRQPKHAPSSKNG